MQSDTVYMACIHLLYLVALLGLPSTTQGQQYLQVSGGDIIYNGERVFLSGMNIAWQNYGMDFGDGQYDCCTGTTLESYIRDIKAAGGNSIRIWIHCDGRMTPKFDGSGFVSATDDSGTFINDLDKFLTVAQQENILVIPVLWNGAEIPTQPVIDLIWDDSKLDSYINVVLRPLVSALRGHVALGSWEIMNEPEGSISAGVSDPNPCFDTMPLDGSGAGWTNAFIPMYNMLRFINRQIAAIRQEDPKALVTVGSWSERSQTDNFSFRNYYKDNCLQDAGGEASGYIDYYQMHTYEWQGSYSANSPMIMTADQYGLDKPNVLGEFSQDGGDGRDITELCEWAYSQGYNGGWTWQANGGGTHSDDFATQARGMAQLQGRNDAGGKVDIILVP